MIVLMTILGLYWCIKAYLDWQDKPVLTTITTTAFPVKSVSSSGFLLILYSLTSYGKVPSLYSWPPFFNQTSKSFDKAAEYKPTKQEVSHTGRVADPCPTVQILDYPNMNYRTFLTRDAHQKAV